MYLTFLHLWLGNLVLRCKVLPRARLLDNAGINYYSVYLRTGDKADLEIAVQFLQDALKVTPEDRIEQAGRLHSLIGGGYHDIYRMTGALADLETAIHHFQEAVKLTSDIDRYRAPRLYDLGIGYRNRYRKTGALTDLEIAIERYEDAVQTSFKDDGRTFWEKNPRDKHWKRYRKNLRSTLDPAIQRSQESLEYILDDHPDQGGRLYNLGSPWHTRYKKTTASTTLEPAAQQSQETLEINFDNSDQAAQLYSLGVAYYKRFENTGALKDLERAIERYKDTLEITTYDHPDRAGRLFSLGVGCRAKYQRTGTLTNLETAFDCFQEALKATPDHHPNRADRLCSLAAAYYERYQRIGALTDLETAIQQYQDAFEATPDDHPEQASRLHNLGASYRARYQRAGNSKDLETAIKRSQEALEITSDDDPDRADRLCNLGAGYGDRYRKIGDLADLETAIQYYYKAVKITPDNHPDRGNRLYNLGLKYRDRHQRTKWAADLKTAIQRYYDALKATPDNHPGRADLLSSLGAGHCGMYEGTRDPAELDQVIRFFEEAIEHPSSGPINRLRPAILLTRIFATAGKWSQAHLVVSTAMSLIPLIVPRFLENADKQHLLSEISGFACDGAAIALAAGKPTYEAVKVLELGRGIILGTSSELRADVSDLKYDHPRLAEQYIQLRNQLDAPMTSADQVFQAGVLTASTLRNDQRYSAGRKIEELIEEIRKLPGFERFLLAPTEEELKASAAQGPLIMINVSDYRCDALLVDPDNIRTLQLPLLHASDIRGRLQILDSGTVDTSLLEWLWETTAKPILNALGLSQTPLNIWPRIWWIPGGPLARFPLHAAGYHSHGKDTVLDRAISSYSSSVGSLIRSRQNSTKPEGLTKSENIVLVGMPELSQAPREIDNLKALCKAMNLQVHEPRRLRENVLAALNNCKIFHFAGHGRTHPLDPFQSALILSDEELTVSRLFEANLHDRQPFLAYLSACGTGRVKFDSLVDESLHLIAAFQLAGFRHVIGTLWEVNDRSCVDMAQLTYERMLERNINDESVSEGLHYACRKLRGQWVHENAAVRAAAAAAAAVVTKREAAAQIDPGFREQSSKPRDARDIVSCDEVPLYWVPYIHFGV